jgi:murein DD-endopeptidase MepM/ murein hydrolase activator NlpD
MPHTTKRIPATLLWLCACLASPALLAGGLPHADKFSVPGGIAVIALGTSEAPRPQARFQGWRVMVISEGGKWHAVVGIPLETRPGKHSLEATVSGKKQTFPFTVRDKVYEAQYITLKDQRKVEPLPADLLRIEREQKLIAQAKAHWRDAERVPLDLSMPVRGPFSSPFGLRRFFNKQPRNPHSGLDIAAAQGTPVGAAAPGQVVTTGDFFFNGKSVFIGHGQGLITMYCHLHRIDVKPGQTLARGQTIGLVGMTGRATGPHLHLSVILNQAMVDPVILLPTGAGR